MTNVRLSLPSVLFLVAIASAAAFAAGRSTSPAAPAVTAAGAAPPNAIAMSAPEDDPLPPGHPPMGTGELPAGHPPIAPSAALAPAEASQSTLAWTAPARWKSVPNSSSMRLATYRVPRADGDAEDAELSITQVGGSVEANAERWIAQFDEEGRRTAKRSHRKVGSLEVTVVEVNGAYAGGMGTEPTAKSSWALLGAIVSTPGMPHFFKLTGPAKTVAAARAEMDALIGSLAQR